MVMNYYGGDETNIQTGGFADYYGGGNNDTLVAQNQGFSQLYGGAGNDILGSVNALVAVYGGEGDDLVEGAQGADSLFGGNGRDFAGGGSLAVSISTGAVSPVGPSGDDLIDGGPGGDGLYGFDGNDTLLGGDGDDAGELPAGTIPGFPAIRGGLFGGDGNDYLDGGRGNDLLDGGAGTDTLIGGLGRDVFEFTETLDTPKGADDTIRDFSAIEHDLIDLSAIDANTKKLGDQAFKLIGDHKFDHKADELRFHHGKLSGDVDGNGKPDFEIVLTGVRHLHAGDLVL